MLSWRRLETRDWDHKSLWNQLTELINQVRCRLIFTLTFIQTDSPPQVSRRNVGLCHFCHGDFVHILYSLWLCDRLTTLPQEVRFIDIVCKSSSINVNAQDTVLLVTYGKWTLLTLTDLHFCICHHSKSPCWYKSIQPEIIMFTLPVIMLEMMSGRMTSFSILMRISPGKPKYCLSRWERDAYSLTTTPKLIPDQKKDRNTS